MRITNLFKKLIKSNQTNEDKSRRELIIKTLVLFSLFGFFIINIIRIADYFIYPEEKGIPLYITLLIFIFFIFLFWLNKQGYLKIATLLLITTFALPMFYSFAVWGTDLPAALLLAVLVIVLSGILLGGPAAFISTLIISISLIFITEKQNQGLLKIEDYWRNDPAQISDVIAHSALLFIIAGVAWLFIKSINKSLARAHLSEKLLKEERDSLEIKVETRTQELLALEADKIKQIYRLAEFGRLSSGIFHDLINPLSAVSLNLEQIKSETDSKILSAKTNLSQALIATNKMASLIASIKKQISREGSVQLFSLNQEIDQVIQILSYKAKRAQTEIIFEHRKEIQLKGDALKFSQVIINILANAIDACEETDTKNILIELTDKNPEIHISIKDSGVGISQENLEKIFLPFFSTKKADGRGFGIGLATSKEIIEKDFAGEIVVKSELGLGANFLIIIKNKMLNKKIEKSPADDWLFWFNQSLSLEEQRKTQTVFKELRHSQNLLWEALNIYDDFFDKEGKISELPRANNYFRRYLDIHSQLKLPKAYFKLQKKLFNQLDKKNYQEIIQKRLDIKNHEIISSQVVFQTNDLSLLSEKSLVLSLSIIALFLLLSPKAQKRKIKSLLNFFKYFLSAKQLSDDSLDWLSDLKNGFISEANLPIILAAKKNGLKLNFKNDLTTINLLFIKEAAPLIYEKLRFLCLSARREIKIVKNINHSLILRRFIDPIESACQKAENFRTLILEN